MIGNVPLRLKRRRHARVEVAGFAQVLCRDQFITEYQVQNISVGGVLLRGGASLGLGEPVQLFLQFVSSGRTFHLEGDVVRREVRGDEQLFGVAFRQLTAAAERTLREMVRATLERLGEASAVLVIDDSVEVCRALGRGLRTLGHRVLFAATPLDAVVQLGSDHHRVNTAFVDLDIGRSGEELLTFLQAEHPLVRRVLVSGDPDQLRSATQPGRAHAILRKPWDRKSLGAVFGPVSL